MFTNKQKTAVFFLIPLLLFLIKTKLSAQTELTGFFDIINTYQLTDQQTEGFQINQFEVDFSRVYKEHLSFGAAIAYNNENNGIDLNMVYLHYNIFNNEVKHPRRTEESKHTGIVIGKFDVPIGLDYLSFASPDRPVFSQPLIIEKTIAGWNDVGVNLHINKKYFRFNFSTINGFNEGINFAGDIAIKFLPGIGLGLFHTSDFNNKINRKSWISGSYLFAEWGMWELKSEYLLANGIYGGEQDTMNSDHRHDGFYIQLLSDLEKSGAKLPVFFTVRYSLWQDENENSPVPLPERIDRWVLGIGYRMNDYSSLRLEFRSEKAENLQRKNQLTGQLVVAF